MIKFIVTYTKDFGETYQSLVVMSDSYTSAYVMGFGALPENAAITSVCPT